MKANIAIFISIVLTVAWIGAIYPEYIELSGAIVVRDMEGNETDIRRSGKNLTGILRDAEPGQVVMKSVILERFGRKQHAKAYQGAHRNEERNDRECNGKNNRDTVCTGD